MAILGIAIVTAIIAVLMIEFLRHRRRNLPLYAWLGLGVLILGEILMFRGVEPISTFFTPIAWTAYILLADGAVLAIRGQSRLHDAPAEFVRTALLSIPLWLIFEAYNLRLKNWTYTGLPSGKIELFFGYAWAFATITPGIFEAADLIGAFGWFDRVYQPLLFSRALEWSIVTLGAACLAIPLLLPQHAAAYLFALVWVGFAFLLDPLNKHLGLPSLLGDLAAGRRNRFWSLLLAGLVCGWFWEFWNYWASSKWHYIFPIMQQSKIFEMPVIGYLGFPPFALECYVMYVTAAWILTRFRVAGSEKALGREQAAD